jgi:transcriptional regulator with XRE-family HTH domain
MVDMPVEIRTKLRALTDDLGSQARVAEILGVSRSRVSRWLRTEEPDADNRRKLEGAEFVVSRLLSIFDRETVLDWLWGFNAHLGNRRPMRLLAAGHINEVLAAIDAEESLAYA